ncbi:MAG: hypothetical protein L3J24_06860 [Xanthomonadales bacterium]|nr:hypothetical protein [Xanthomonadales bacterium]
MKFLKLHAFALWCSVLFGQFAYADSVTLGINGLNINADWVTADTQPQEVEVDGADHFFHDLYVDDIVDSIVDLLETNQ